MPIWLRIIFMLKHIRYNTVDQTRWTETWLPVNTDLIKDGKINSDK